MKTLFKAAFIFLLAFGGLTTVSSEVDAAQPYEYDFTTGNEVFNGITGVKDLTITLDGNLSVADQDGDNDGDESDLFNEGSNDPVYVLKSGGTKRINIIKDVKITGRVITISFKNLEYLNYSDPSKLVYELKINKGSLRFDQVSDYTLPFNIYDVLPGFGSTFIGTNADDAGELINKYIFKHNAPRDVMIHVPKMYMTGIETIHRYNGIVKDVDEPNLTNIDILADEEATRLKVDFNGQEDNSRDLSRRTDEVEGFTMGQAGIEALICSDNIGSDVETCPDANRLPSVDEFTLKAFNEYGRFLEENSFKLRVNNLESDFIVDNYITASPDVFGQTYRLYDLMKEPEIMDEIMQHITEEDLDRIGVTYGLGSTTVNPVTDIATLNLALQNPDIKVINLSPAGIFDKELTIDRDVIINANNAEFSGNVNIGKGEDVIVRLNKASVTGGLNIDAGDNGTVIFDDVMYTGTLPAGVISGGSNSIHLNNFTSTNGIEMKNTKPVRLVTTTTIPDLIVSGTGGVTLEGTYTNVTFKETANLNANSNTDIGRLVVTDKKQVTVAGIGWAINIADESKDRVTVPKNENSPVHTWKLDNSISANSDAWSGGLAVNIITSSSPQSLKEGTNWSIKADTFEGVTITGSYVQNQQKLQLINLPETGTHEGEIVLEGINGAEIYNVTIPIQVSDN